MSEALDERIEGSPAEAEEPEQPVSPTQPEQAPEAPAQQNDPTPEPEAAPQQAKEPAQNPQFEQPQQPAGFRGAADPVSGSYSYVRESAPSPYADAHYEPAGETTAPPRYYTPPQRSEKPRREKKASGRAGAFVRTVALCLICALLGGLLGAGLMGARVNDRLSSLESSVQQSSEQSAQALDAAQEAARQSAAVDAQAVAAQSSELSAAQIYEQACRQVVGITTSVTYTNYFGMQTSSPVSGSGFILSADGYILTNYHVIEYADQNRMPVTVMMHDGTQYQATIVGTEQANDIAVLKIEASGLTPVTFGDSDSLQVGDTIYAVGNPLGELEFSMSTGHVSALDRVITTEDSEAINMFQIDAAVNPGNSGGPVYNAAGQVVGIVTAKYSETGVEGLGFAIPANDASRLVDDLISLGYVTGKAYMGVRLDERYNEMYAQYYDLPVGAYVYSVDSGTAAAKAGLQSGDIIVALGEYEVASFSDLRQALRHFSAGDTATVSVYRNGETIELSITFDEARPDNAS